MKEEFVHSLDEVLVATGSATSEGEVIDMFLLTIKVFRQDKDGRHPPQALPEIWMEPREVANLIQSLQSSLIRHFPLDAEELGVVLKMSDAPRLLS